MSDVKVSVIIPAYNAAEFIGRAVESVLSQTHRALEVIVVDDGSDDGTADAVSRLAASEARLHLVRMPNSGPAVARNRGMEAISADAEYVMFVDADDYLAPDAVERALSAAQDGAELIYGVNKDMTREEFAASIENGTLLENVNRVKVKPGDVVFIPSGMLHAIGAGILLAEVQQSSNTTYRVFDYERRDKNGNKRELHVKKATDVVTLTKTTADFSAEGEEEQLDGATKKRLTHCRYFSMTQLKTDGEFTDEADDTSFVSLLVLDGEGKISASGKEYEIKKGSSVFIPAGYGKYTLTGKFTALETRT